METNELRNKLKIKQTELNLTHDPEKRKVLQTDIAILNHKLSIERIKDIIHSLEQQA